MDLLRAGLTPFVSEKFEKHHRGQSVQVLEQTLRRPIQDRKSPFGELDTAALLRVMWESWNEVYRDTLGRTERSLVSELRDVRNRWAHQEPFSGDDAYRALDSTHRLLKSVSSPQAGEVEKMKKQPPEPAPEEQPSDGTDLVVVVPARKRPFCHLFLGQGGEHCWHEISISTEKLAKMQIDCCVPARCGFCDNSLCSSRLNSEPYFVVSAMSLLDGTGQMTKRR